MTVRLTEKEIQEACAEYVNKRLSVNIDAGDADLVNLYGYDESDEQMDIVDFAAVVDVGEGNALDGKEVVVP